jgi:hypothetical protein
MAQGKKGKKVGGFSITEPEHALISHSLSAKSDLIQEIKEIVIF